MKKLNVMSHSDVYYECSLCFHDLVFETIPVSYIF